mgnify:CR=1 FL=1
MKILEINEIEKNHYITWIITLHYNLHYNKLAINNKLINYLIT